MNEQRIRITFACTDEIRRIMENIGDGYGWPDAVCSTLRDAAEHCATGTFPLEQGVPARELLWFPTTQDMDGVSIGTLECLGDEAQEDSGARLAAAAPDLLAACRALCTMIDVEDHDVDSVTIKVRDLVPRVREARAAIGRVSSAMT